MDLSADKLIGTAYNTALWPARLTWRIASGMGTMALGLSYAAARQAAGAISLLETDADVLRQEMPYHEAKSATADFERAATKPEDSELLQVCLRRLANAVENAAEHTTDTFDARTRVIIEQAAVGFETDGVESEPNLL